MAGKEILYFARGKTPDGKRYKLVKGAVKRSAEARGEDHFYTRFEAIYTACKALRAWSMRPMGLVFDVDVIEREVDV